MEKRRLDTFKWLEKLVKRNHLHSILNYVYARFGRIYALDGYILAMVEFEDLGKIGEDDWETLNVDDYSWHEAENKLRIDFFERLFMGNKTSPEPVIIDADYLNFAIKPFRVNKINPTIALDKDSIELSGHDENVSIKVKIMGRRY